MPSRQTGSGKLEASALFPNTDANVDDLIPDFCWAVGRAAAATVLSDNVLTVAEYEALAESAASLEGLSSYPGLMSYLILRGVSEDPSLGPALKDLKKTSRGLPEDVRQSIFEAVRGVCAAQGDQADSVRRRWADALGVETDGKDSESNAIAASSSRWLVGGGRRFVTSAKGWLKPGNQDSGEVLIERAKLLASAFQDEELERAISGWEADGGVGQPGELKAALARAADRAFNRASARLKSKQDLEQQTDLAVKFLQTTQALADQVSSRLRSVEARLQLQSEMFHEDLENFVDGSLDALQIEMGELVKGRRNWAGSETWEAFREGAAYAELMSRFAPIQRRYGRLFDQWQRELESFSTEAGTIRATVLSSVDTRVFSSLVPSQHSTAALKCALDRVSDATLGFSVLGVLGVGAAAVAGVVQAGVVIAALANPVGATIGAVVGVAALWKIGSNAEKRKDKLVKDKREQIKKGLQQLLENEGLNHDELAGEVLTKFVEAAVEQYTPLIVEARLWAMKARLEPGVNERVLEGTRSFLSLPG